MAEPVVRGVGVSFGYPRRKVFQDLAIEIERGVTGLLGPNGAGKTTMLSLISTRRATGSGHLSVLGHDTATAAGREAIRREVGVLAQRYPLIGSMRVDDTVAYAAWTHGLSIMDSHRAAARTLEALGVGDLSGRRVRSLSGGQRQRIGLAAAMVHEPGLLVLDEPTAGLDPEARMAMRRTLREVAVGASILISTHLVDDVLALCDSIIVLDGGRIVFQGAPQELESLTRVASLGGDSVREMGGSPFERGYEALLVRGRSREV